MSWNSMSGAGDSATPSVSTSRSMRPPMGKSGGAASAASSPACSSGGGKGRWRRPDCPASGPAVSRAPVWLRAEGLRPPACRQAKLSEHARGFFAAGYAEIEPLFGFGEQRVRIVLAMVAALAAILLSHRRHQPPRQRLAVGKLHALG